MRLALSIVAVTGLSLLAAGLAAGDDKKGDAKQLQGTWVIDPASYKDEKDVGVREEAARVRVIFDGESITIKQGTERRADRGRFRLDTSNNPKHIDVLNEQAGLEMQGIYELHGDKLKLCWDRGGRPKKFAGGDARSGGPSLFVLIREKKK
jgi:uncharacterized protein (TIGR03067 family)